MLRHGCQTVCSLLIATFAACAAILLASDDIPPLPSSGFEKSLADESQMAGDGESGYSYPAQQERSRDLTLANFFSAGWDDEWAKQERATGTPNLALLRVQTNFMEREFRANYYFENNAASSTTKNLTDFDTLIAWSFDRRLMLEITGAYQWTDPRTGVREDGGNPGLVGRVQLIDTESSSYSFNFKALAPNQELGVTQSTISYGVAGFEDLAYWFGANRVGLYYSFLFDSLTGPVAKGAKLNDIGYDITLAKTVTDPTTPLLGNLTFFVENYAQTDLDGSHNGRTLVSITPGVRFNLGKSDRAKMGKDNWIMFGPDIPISDYKPWDAIYRFTYIKNF
ncbi:MAG: hypothetical protein ACLP9L_09670 [Thermoguttaceae bacterium]